MSSYLKLTAFLFVLVNLKVQLLEGHHTVDGDILNALKEAGKRVGGPFRKSQHPGQVPIQADKNGLFREGNAVIAPVSGHKLFELDMVLTEKEEDALIGRDKIRYQRAALRDEQKRWPDATIPYAIATHQFSSSNLQLIQDAMDRWTDATCIEFRPKTSIDSNYLNILGNTDGCWSYVGYHGNRQDLNLETPGCMYLNTIVHEIGHAIGLHHEQSRPDRDSYVNVLWGNILPGYENNFNKYDTTRINSQNTPYDYLSLMHYSRNYFAVEGQDTLQTIDPYYQNKIGQAPHLSFRDAAVVNKMYGCSVNKPTNAEFLGIHCMRFTEPPLRPTSIRYTYLMDFEDAHTYEIKEKSNACSNVNCPTTEHYIGKDCECYCPTNGGVDIVKCTVPPPEPCIDVWGFWCTVFSQDCGNSQVSQNCRKTCNVC